MWIEVGKWIVILFGIFFIAVAFIMLLCPKIARQTLRKAGSTNLINYSEITIRMIPAIGLILVANHSKFTEIFYIFGWFMLVTSFILYFIPKDIHHNFSNKCADILKPSYFQLISPFSFFIGILLIYSVY